MMVKRKRNLEAELRRQEQATKNNQELEAEAMKCLSSALSMSNKPVVAYSGGKDGIVVAHMAKRLGVEHFICETSFYFPKALESIKKVSDALGLNVVYRDSLPKSWLMKNKDLIFTNDSSRRGWSFSARQQRTVKKYAKEVGADLQIFGRRTEENTVKAKIYITKSGKQCHPLKDWLEFQIWEYFDRHNIPIPYIYQFEFARSTGNAPWYAVNPDHVGGVDECWRLVNEIDPTIKREDYE